MTTLELIPQKVRKRLARTPSVIAQLRRQRYQLRRKTQFLAETIAEHLRPISVNSRDPGRLTAAMTLSSTLIALLLVLACLLIVALYGPVAHDSFRAIGFHA